MPAAPFHVELLWPSPGVGLVDVAGEVDMNTAEELGTVLVAALQGEPDRLIVDLTTVGFIDSIGLSVLVQNAKLVLAQGAGFEIVCTEKIAQVFEITGLHDVLTFRPSRADALAQ